MFLANISTTLQNWWKYIKCSFIEVIDVVTVNETITREVREDSTFETIVYNHESHYWRYNLIKCLIVMSYSVEWLHTKINVEFLSVWSNMLCDLVDYYNISCKLIKVKRERYNEGTTFIICKDTNLRDIAKELYNHDMYEHSDVVILTVNYVCL